MKSLVQVLGLIMTYGALVLQHGAWRFLRIPRLRNVAAIGVILCVASWVILKVGSPADPDADIPTINMIAFIVPLIVGAVLFCAATVRASYLAQRMAQAAQRIALAEDTGCDEGLYVATVGGKYRTVLDDLREFLPVLQFLPQIPDRPQMTEAWVRGRIAEVELQQEKLDALLNDARVSLPLRKRRWWMKWISEDG